MQALPLQDIRFNKDADLILGKARKESLGWSVPSAALCEELIFIAFAALKHPLYVSLMNRFSLSTNIVTNTLHKALMASKKDAPTKPNKTCEDALFKLMWQEAQADSSTAITEQHVMAAVFKHRHPANAVLNYFTENGVRIEHVLKFVKEYKHVDWVAELEETERHRSLYGEVPVLSEVSTMGMGSKLSNPENVLEQFGRNLTQLAREGKAGSIYGRDAEIAAVEEILARMSQNNPILIGPPGVGKTAIVEGFARRVATDSVPERLKDKEVWQINMGSLVAGTTLRGQFEERVRAIMKVCEEDLRIITRVQ